MPPATLVLLILNIGAYLLQQAAITQPLDPLALWPPASGLFAPWQLLTSSFLHGSIDHLVFNMLGLWMFGADLERLWGPGRFLFAYFLSVLCGSLAQLSVALFFDPLAGPVIGASGGVFGLLLAFALLFPERRLMLLFLPIPVKARTFVLAYGAIELLLGLTQTQAGVAHFAHLGGMLGGWLASRRKPAPPPGA
jgi:membrane associated rhomboid family serine protease